jgi:hypothetical protein
LKDYNLLNHQHHSTITTNQHNMKFHSNRGILFAFKLMAFILFAFTLFSACSAAKKTGRTGDERTLTAQQLIQKLETQSIDYEWFEGRSKMQYIDMKQNQTIKAVIRMKKDSVIWMSFQMFGIEGARIKMTPDSVYILNRLNKEYAIQPLSLVEEMTNIPADFKALQALLIGNPVFYPTEYTLENRDSFYILSTDTILNTTYSIQKPSLLLNRMTLRTAQNQKMEMDFKRHEPLEDGRIFSMLRDILITSPTSGNASVEIEYNKVIFESVKSTSFDIPKDYKKMDGFPF